MKNVLYSILLYVNFLLAAFLLLSYLSVFVNPEIFWLMAFMGLAYPFLLIINIIFAIFWMFRWNKIFLVSLISILIGWNNITNHFQIPLSRKNIDKTFNDKVDNIKTIKVLSYNVRLFDRYNWSEQKDAKDKIINFILSNNPDILCLQEYFTSAKSDLSERKIKSVLKQYKYSHVYYNIKTKDLSNFGIVTFSKYPIIEKGVIKFENTFNTGIYTDIKTNNDTIRIYNNHLQSIKLKSKNYDFFTRLSLRDQEQLKEFKDISSRLRYAYIMRARQVDLISKHAEDSPFPVILCGDFNDTPVSYTYKKVKGNMKDAFVESGIWTGSTYVGSLPSFRIDYLFFDKKRFNSYNYRTHRVAFSDHYPISCYFELK